jgi:tetratricopeptide (TPR) repeat protein
MPTRIESRSPLNSPSQRKFLLRDALVFVVLTCISLALYAVTLFLFKSLQGHRASLAIYWSNRGKIEMAHGHADQAVASLRNALSYSPYDRSYELLLAESLADSGQTDQAMNYFLSLWDTQPGDGFTNLELARLCRTKGLTQQAINYYHASIFGDWRGDGTTHRRNVRVELANYLTSIHDTGDARAELLIASGNASNNAAINASVGTDFAAIGDAPDALNSFKRAVEINPRDQSALEAAGRLSLQLSDYAAAHDFFEKDIQLGIQDPTRKDHVLALLEEATRLGELAFSPNLPNHERAEHLLIDKGIAEARFNSCAAQVHDPTQDVPATLELQQRWKAVAHVRLRALEDDETLQESLSTLITDTEVLTSKACGTPSGDDAILLRLARPGVSNQ